WLKSRLPHEDRTGLPRYDFAPRISPSTISSSTRSYQSFSRARRRSPPTIFTIDRRRHGSRGRHYFRGVLRPPALVRAWASCGPPVVRRCRPSLHSSGPAARGPASILAGDVAPTHRSARAPFDLSRGAWFPRGAARLGGSVYRQLPGLGRLSH